MARRAQHEPILLHSMQEIATKLAWERMDGEPARWFMRFRTYCLLGRGRSLQAAVAQERELLVDVDEEVAMKKALRGIETPSDSQAASSLDAQHIAEYAQEITPRKDALTRELAINEKSKDIVVPGAWRRACKTWQWVDRATAYDEYWRQEQHRQLVSFIDHTCLYITKAQRLSALDTLASALMSTIMNEHLMKKERKQDDVSQYLACIKAMHAVLRDIRKEMSTLDLSDQGKRPYA